MPSSPFSSSSPPPGQRTGGAFPRFGFGARWSLRPAESAARLRVSGAVEEEAQIELSELEQLPRCTQTSDMHCVTTWTKRGLTWSGWRLREVYESILVPRCRPRPEVRFLVLFGLDGYRCTLHLEDALAEDLLIVDTLDGEPLSPLHGAPLRVVSPRQYAYKSLKHLAGFALRAEPPSGLRFGLEHPRGRVRFQERHSRLPPWLVRLPYRALIAPTVFANRRGLTSRHFVGGPTLLDEIMPEMDVNQVHDLFVEAPPSAVYSALGATTGGEVRFLGSLMALRGLPARLIRKQIARGSQRPVFEGMVDAGFVELGEEPGREIVLGAIGRFWKLTANAPLRFGGRAEFLAFDEPGYAKAVMSFLVRSEGEGSRLITETRVAGTDVTASRRFRRYWRFIRLGSGAIRRSWLAAVRRRVAG